MINVVKEQEKSGVLIDNFYGSPTVNYSDNDRWIDLFGETGESRMACRSYTYEGKMTPYIPLKMLKERFRELLE